MQVKPTHPLAEIIARCLFGIESVPKEHLHRFVTRACKRAVEYHEEVLREIKGKGSKNETE